jgi:hypothetical protein
MVPTSMVTTMTSNWRSFNRPISEEVDLDVQSQTLLDLHDGVWLSTLSDDAGHDCSR